MSDDNYVRSESYLRGTNNFAVALRGPRRKHKGSEMDGPYKANGLKFSIGKYRIRVWKTGWEYDDGMTGRCFFFWWHPSRWSDK